MCNAVSSSAPRITTPATVGTTPPGVSTSGVQSFHSLSLDDKKQHVAALFSGEGVLVRTIQSSSRNLKFDLCARYLPQFDATSSEDVGIKRMSWIKEDRNNMLYKFGAQTMPRTVAIIYDPGRLQDLVLKVSTQDEASNHSMSMAEVQQAKANRAGAAAAAPQETLGQEMLRRGTQGQDPNQNNEIVTLPGVQEAIVGFVVLGDANDFAHVGRFEGALTELAGKGGGNDELRIHPELQGKTFPVFVARPDEHGVVKTLAPIPNGLTIPIVPAQPPPADDSTVRVFR